MANKKNDALPQPGTVEYEAQKHWEREVAAFEEATGKKVKYVPPVPVTRTPIAVQAEEKPLSAMTKVVLVSHAASLGVAVTPSMSKAQIVEAIEAAAAKSEDTADPAGAAGENENDPAEGEE